MIWFGNLVRRLNSPQGKVAFGLNLPETSQFNPTANGPLKDNLPEEIKAVLSSKPECLPLTVDQTILREAEKKVREDVGEDFSPSQKIKGLVVGEIVSGLKSQKRENTSLFEHLVIGMMDVLDPYNMHRFYKGATCLVERSHLFPKGFPFQLRKTAEAIVVGKIKDIVGVDEVVDYLVKRQKDRSIDQMRKDVSFASEQGIDPVNFACLSFALGQLSCAPSSVRSKDLRQAIAEGMKEGVLDIVHVKCLRFIYPRGGGVRVLTDTDDVEVDGALGRYRPKSEERLFTRLLALKALFERHGIGRARLSVLVADEDIDLLYSRDNSYVSEENKREAKRNSRAYVEFLRSKYDQQLIVYPLTEYLSKNGLESSYQTKREEVIYDLRRGQGKFVNPNFFEINRVDHQYEYYQRLIGSTYTRDEARRSSVEQMASTLAIGIVFAHFPKPMFVVEENRGGENNLIAEGKFPLFFTQLRDQAIFGEMR